MNGNTDENAVDDSVDLHQMLTELTEEQVTEMMQQVANTHGLAMTAIRIPEGVDAETFAKAIAAKLDEIDVNGQPTPTPAPASPVPEYMKLIMKQKAEIERANIQHCEHNSRASLALQVFGITLHTDKDVNSLPESILKMIDTAANTLRDTMIGAPVE
jgi:hypothetical protein